MVNEQITLGSVITWTNDPGAAQTHVVCLIVGGGQIGEAFVNAPDNSIDVLQFLTGQSVASYAFRLSSIDANSQEGSYAEVVYDYGAPPPPTNIMVV